MRLGNLTRTALAEFRAIMRQSRDYGPQTARATQLSFIAVFDAVAEGRALGHIRSDVTIGSNFRFISVKRTSFVVVYDQDRKLVVRIVHGRRDFRTLVLDGSNESRTSITGNSAVPRRPRP